MIVVGDQLMIGKHWKNDTLDSDKRKKSKSYNNYKSNHRSCRQDRRTGGLCTHH